jgi:hypothetical protein
LTAIEQTWNLIDTLVEFDAAQDYDNANEYVAKSPIRWRRKSCYELMRGEKTADA